MTVGKTFWNANPLGTGTAIDPNNLEGQCEVELWWDRKGSGNSIDLDLQCIAFDGDGVVVDACFFNNPVAAGGAMMLSGDSRDGLVEGQPDETCTIQLGAIPPHAAAVLCCAFCTTKDAFLNDVANLRAVLKCGGQVVLDSSGACDTLPKNTTGMIALKFFRHQPAAPGGTMPTKWVGELEEDAAFTRGRNFVDNLIQLQTNLHIPKVMQIECAKLQPVFNMKKGEAVAMPTGLKTVGMGLGWDSRCDVDASIVALHGNGAHTEIYFGNLKDLNNSVRHSGDNTTGEGAGDDETIRMDLTNVPKDVNYLFLTVNIYTGGDFTDVEGEFVRVYNDESQAVANGQKKEFLRYTALDNSGAANGVIIGVLFRQAEGSQANYWQNKLATGGMHWEFKALSLPVEGNTCKAVIDECQDLAKCGLDVDAFCKLPHRAGYMNQFRK